VTAKISEPHPHLSLGTKRKCVRACVQARRDKHMCLLRFQSGQTHGGSSLANERVSRKRPPTFERNRPCRLAGLAKENEGGSNSRVDTHRIGIKIQNVWIGIR
jgi:hypothetical protein